MIYVSTESVLRENLELRRDVENLRAAVADAYERGYRAGQQAQAQAQAQKDQDHDF